MVITSPIMIIRNLSLVLLAMLLCSLIWVLVCIFPFSSSPFFDFFFLASLHLIFLLFQINSHINCSFLLFLLSLLPQRTRILFLPFSFLPVSYLLQPYD